MLRKLFVGIIQLYQKSLSPDHGYFKRYYPAGYCRFQPTCSDYAIMAIRKNGVLLGSLRGFYRILRCNPWNQGGLDIP